MHSKIFKLASAILAIGLIVSCGSSKKMVDNTEDKMEEVVIQETLLDTLEVTASRYDTIADKLPTYQASHHRTIDILHTDLDLHFDWKNQYVIGKAKLDITPLFYPIDMIELDAVGFEINSLQVNGSDKEYDYDGQKLAIKLNKSYKKGEKLVLKMDYIAKPNENPIGGSQAITSDKGLFFINPIGEEKDKPTQIWTQGQTENNSRWFPTVDKPNERNTQEIRLTVEDKYTTLSNGILATSVKNADGTRTDHWKMNQPHAPYLAMIAVGEFAKVSETWNGKEVSYFVEKEYEKDAKKIFEHTKEMIQYFSDLLDYPYPWDKYSQIVVRDYVSGAMENTTASIFGEFVQKTERELIDGDNDFIVAHELFHQWFGDLVTCENWANLTMNEGFANYSEYLWKEYKDGINTAEEHRFNEMGNYIYSAKNQGVHDLINFGYEDKEEMFDAHSYNKGGLVLHMLRNYVGDEAFFAALHNYLVTNAYTAVEVHDLRLAFERVTGMDLNWFFNQWYLSAGHPSLDISYTYDSTAQALDLHIIQTQDEEGVLHIFQLPFDVEWMDENGELQTHSFMLNERDQTFSIPMSASVSYFNFDPKEVLLAEKKITKSKEQWGHTFHYAKNLIDRLKALNKSSRSKNKKEIITKALTDEATMIRRRALDMSDRLKDGEEIISSLKNMALYDEKSTIRARAVEKLAKRTDSLELDIFEKIIKNDRSFKVMNAALGALANKSETKSLEMIDQQNLTQYKGLINGIASVYASSSDDQYLDFFKNGLTKVGFENLFGFSQKYAKYLNNLPTDTAMNTAAEISSNAMNDQNSIMQRAASFLALQQLNSLYSSKEDMAAQIEDLTQKLDNIYEWEPNPMMKSQYGQMLGK